MPLLDSELDRLKYELGFNDLLVGAEPYIGVARIFENVIQPYLREGGSTTSTTSVTAVTVGSPATPVAITLASPTGFAAYQTLIVDVDERQERATLQSISGSVATVLLRNAHTGTYPVDVEGGVTMVRARLKALRELDDLIIEASSMAGIKQVDKGDVIFFGDKESANRLGALVASQTKQRAELFRLLFGVGSLGELQRRNKLGGGGRFEVY